MRKASAARAATEFRSIRHRIGWKLWDLRQQELRPGAALGHSPPWRSAFSAVHWPFKQDLTNGRCSMIEFRDAAGCLWEVFEVKRSSARDGGVSSGRETGWLSFHNGQERRRLSPVPVNWTTSPPQALIGLLHRAAVVAPWRTTGPYLTHLDRRATPREDTAPTPLDHAVREAARDSRASGDTVVAALLKLRAMLAERGIDRSAPEFGQARKLFLDVFYFAPRA
jgi:hypothetical protein